MCSTDLQSETSGQGLENYWAQVCPQPDLSQEKCEAI